MEERKFDPYQFIGFVLIAMILTWMLYQNQPQTEPQKNEATTEVPAVDNLPQDQKVNDSIQQLALQNSYGDLANLMTLNRLEN